MRVRGGQHRLRGRGDHDDQGPREADGARLEVPMTDEERPEERATKHES